jgi:hypothetical protein
MAARASKSDDESCAELASLAPLNEATAASEAVFWVHATLYLAYTEISAERLVKPAAKLILERAERGDPGSIVRR